jgi:LmbE family N-acetylglucosaminyl deacetylase
MQEDRRIPYAASALPVDGAASVLILAPHPDDEVFGCGGCAALFVRAGVRVQSLILTDGGLWGQPQPGLDVVATREAESHAAAALLRCEEPLFARLGDKTLNAGDELIELVATHVRRARADVLMAPSLWEIHPDHRAAAQVAIETVQRLPGLTLVQYEVGAPLLPNALVDITPVHELKLRAMACFPSQLAMQHYDRHIDALNTFRTYTLPADVRAAEAIRVASAAEAASDPYGFSYRGSVHPAAR